MLALPVTSVRMLLLAEAGSEAYIQFGHVGHIGQIGHVGQLRHIGRVAS